MYPAPCVLVLMAVDLAFSRQIMANFGYWCKHEMKTLARSIYNMVSAVECFV